MGNNVGSRPSDAAGKVVLSDGRVQNLEEPTTVAELMLEHPRHVVVEFDPSSISFNHRDRKNDGKTIKKRLTPLPADKTLEPGKIYLMLPAKRGGAKSASAAVAASEEVRRMLLTTTAVLRSSSSYYEGIIPWFARIYPAAGGRDVAEKITSAAPTAAEAEDEEEEERMRPEYLSRQLSGKGWKPSLDTIKEKKVIKKKIHQWLSF